MTDESLGIDGSLVARAMSAFPLPASARASRASFQGTFHRLFEVAGAPPYVLRVASMRGAGEAALMSLECRAMNALREQGFPIPACDYRAIDDGGEPRGAHLVARVEGPSLTSLDGDEPRMTQALEWVGEFLARLHRVRGSGFGPLSLARWDDARFYGVHETWAGYVHTRLDEHVATCRRIGALDDSEARAIASHFAGAAEPLAASPSALLHGDPGSHNFIVDGEGIRAVIDWEDALLGDPLFDLASLCTFHPERRHAAIFRAYGAPIARGSGQWTRFWLYFLRVSLAKTVHRHRFGYADRAGRAPASRRIQLALERLREH